jgi:hypothetical protein
MRKLILAILALLAAPAAAQTVPPGQWSVGEQPIAYPVIGSDNIYVDGSCNVAECGVPDFFALQPANIPSTITDQVVPGGFTTGDDEGKWRGTLFGSHVLADDPLRNHCDRGASHLHEFLGSKDAGACSTFQQLREDCIAKRAADIVSTTSPGDDVNCTPYWHPALIDEDPLGDGVDRIKKVYAVPLYYQIALADPDVAATYIDFPLGFGYVNGNNMDDPFMLKLKGKIAEANAANAAAGGGGSTYYYNGNGSGDWSCTEPDGTPRDGPEDSTDDLTCEAGDLLIASMNGAQCADGVNLTSPSGYDHVLPAIQVSAINGTRSDVCPINWWHIAILTNKPQWVLHSAISAAVPGDSPYLSSDAMFQANARAQAGLPGAPGDAASFVCKPGCSRHFDYGPIAWDKKFLRRLFRKCLGIPWTDTSETGLDADQTPYITACIDPTISTTGGGGTATQLQISHQVRFPDVNGDTIDEYYPTPAPLGHMGPHTMEGQ